jgi:membrane protein implicated in regulation of membrane protease activity
VGGRTKIIYPSSNIQHLGWRAGYNPAVTWGFAFLLIFLGGFTLSLVTGFARRLLHPTELCDHVVLPSHEHLHSLRFPAADLLSSFLTVFGCVCLLAHGLTPLAPPTVVALGTVAGIIGIFVFRSWLSRVCDPTDKLEATILQVRVVREIPSDGYGQVEVEIEGTPLKLAARGNSSQSIPVGSVVEILDRSESVVVVRPSN